MDESVIERKLDTIASILKLAFGEQLSQVREAMRSEAGKAAILDSGDDWTPAGELVKEVMKNTGRSKRSIQRDIGEMLDLGVLEKRGAARSLEYRTAGVI